MSVFRRFIVFIMVGVLLLTTAAANAQTFDIIDPGNNEPYHPALLHFRLGYYYQLRGNHTRAVDEFTQVIEGLPNWDSGYAARGDSYAALALYDLAITDYDAAMALTPDFVSVLYMRGRAYQSLDQTDAAFTDFTSATETAPTYPLPYWGLGDLYLERGERANALVQYQTYLTLTGSDASSEVMAQVAQLQTVVAAETL